MKAKSAQKNVLVSVVMGSDSDLPIMTEATKILEEFSIAYELILTSAHRTPLRTTKFATSAAGRGVKVIIVGAGAAAHLAGVIASQTILPIIGVPINATALNGLDALLSTVQMPGGIPVATMAIGSAGAKNAALFAVRILAIEDKGLSAKLSAYIKKMARDVEKKAGKTHMPEVLKIGADNSEEKIIARAVEILAGGGIIAYPTETFYGLGADATNKKAIEKIFSAKGRNFNNPISLIIGQPDDIYPLVQNVPESAKKLMAAFWPGALTIVFSAADILSPLLTAGSGKIGLRVSSHPIALRIVQKLKNPLTATSANLSGAPECSRASEVAGQIGDKLDAIVDCEETQGGKTSTIIDVTCDPPVILREGAISGEAIKKCVNP